MKGLLIWEGDARFMRINNQAKVGLVTVICLLCQGYIFTYILGVEPHPLISFVPLIPYIAYIYARGGRTWYFNKPLYWMAAIIALTALDIMPHALGVV
jgi:hypothetical protein